MLAAHWIRAFVTAAAMAAISPASAAGARDVLLAGIKTRLATLGFTEFKVEATRGTQATFQFRKLRATTPANAPLRGEVRIEDISVEGARIEAGVFRAGEVKVTRASFGRGNDFGSVETIRLQGLAALENCIAEECPERDDTALRTADLLEATDIAIQQDANLYGIGRIAAATVNTAAAGRTRGEMRVQDASIKAPRLAPFLTSADIDLAKIDLSIDATYDETERRYALDMMATLPGMAKASLSMTLGNVVSAMKVVPQTVKSAPASPSSGKDPDASTQALQLMSKAVIERLSFRLDNERLFDRLLFALAKERGVKTYVLRSDWMNAASAFSTTLDTGRAKIFRIATYSFITEPKSLSMTAVPKAPIVLTLAVGMGVMAPGKLLDMIDAEFRANE